ncbi:hypothetical protein E3W66_02350 [Gammaproteobacteria bacterium LSUCC0057]|uniref:TonB-dependent receptor n=1 Tax=Gammaproteobacteria bacterium LSUCC0057 TaxID=2559237 RepID=A0A4Y8UNE7_9GAMM|nr:hypothetical protein E3W66_02350 [Gammaproteobacteria bacterium LSUCC0057]
MSIAKPFQKTALVMALMTASGAYAAIEEVIVTAEKREANLQETPIAINALTADMIEQKGISSISDLFEKVPGVVGYEAPSSRGNISVNIRGIGSGNSNSPSSDPANAIYVDGVYLGVAAGTGVDAMDLERVEVLKGPQGTLYGRNSTGGAINFITKKPGEEAAAKIKAGIGSKGHESLSMRFDVPVSDTLGVAVSAYSRQRDDLYSNTNSAQSGFENIDRQGYRFAARFEPTETLSLDYAFNHDELDEHTQMMGVVGFNPMASAVAAIDGFPNAVSITGSSITQSVNATGQGVAGFVLAGMAPGDFGFDQVSQFVGWTQDYVDWANSQDFDTKPSSGSSDSNSESTNEVDAHSLSLTWDLSDSVQLKSITGFREVSSMNNADLDGMNNSVDGGVMGSIQLLTIGGLFFNQIPDLTGQFVKALDIIDAINERGRAEVFNTYATIDHEQFSQEFQVVGSTDNLDYAAGVYFYNADAEFRNHQLATFPLASSQTKSYDISSEAASLFGQATWRPAGQKWALTAGLRYTEETKEITYLWQGMSFFGMTDAFSLGFAGVDFGESYVTNAETLDLPERANYGDSFEEDFSNLSGKLTAQYFINDDTNVYATYSTGYRSGGFNGDVYNFATGAADAFDEETITSMELGLKTTFWDGKAQLNGAIFSYSYDDMQVSTLEADGGSISSSIANAGQADREGLELSLLLAPTDNLLLSIDYTAMDGDFDEYPANITADLSQDMTDIAKRGLSPDNQLLVGADWTLMDSANGVLSLSANVSYQDETQPIAASVDKYTIGGVSTPVTFAQHENDSRTLVNARLSWSKAMASSNLVVSLWGQNITDEEYGVFGFNYGASVGLNLHQYGAPRTVGLDITWEM